MNRKGYDLAVVYRIYPRISQSPAFFPEDKYRLAELSLASFREALGELRAKLWVLLDGCPPEYERLFRERFAEEDLELIHLPGVGNGATFERQLDILLEQSDAEAVYFAEDDYFYLPNAIVETLEFLNSSPDVDFVSAYDHPDYYNRALHRHRNVVRASAGRHWRTANSTCLTFLTRRETLRRTQHVLRSYARGNLDFTMWLGLTRRLPRPRRAIAKFLIGDGLVTRRFLKSQLPGLLNLTRSACQLWTPMPSLATHLESTCLAPGVDWQARADELADRAGRKRANSTGGRHPMAPFR
jgi:hypothetical protein